MTYRKQIVCLANSPKPGGHCVAGKEVSNAGYGQWIRPVSVRPSAEISFDERQYENGSDPQILDIIDIPMLAPVPRVHQTENHMIDADYYWTRTGAVAWDDLADMEETPNTLWINGDSTYHGTYDRVAQTAAAQLRNSLLLIKPEHVIMRVLTPGAISVILNEPFGPTSGIGVRIITSKSPIRMRSGHFSRARMATTILLQNSTCALAWRKRIPTGTAISLSRPSSVSTRCRGTNAAAAIYDWPLHAQPGTLH